MGRTIMVLEMSCFCEIWQNFILKYTKYKVSGKLDYTINKMYDTLTFNFYVWEIMAHIEFWRIFSFVSTGVTTFIHSNSFFFQIWLIFCIIFNVLSKKFGVSEMWESFRKFDTTSSCFPAFFWLFYHFSSFGYHLVFFLIQDGRTIMVLEMSFFLKFDKILFWNMLKRKFLVN